jgi:hypothetical protein
VSAPVSPLSPLQAAPLSLYGLVLCLLGGLCTELSSFKVKATLTNVNTTASASSLLDQQRQPLPMLSLPL